MSTEDLKLEGWSKMGVYERGEPRIFNISKPSGWECEMYGMGRSYVFRPREGEVPNRFWRWMQYLAFGNKWRKVGTGE